MRKSGFPCAAAMGVCILLGLSGAAAGDVPRLIHFQGKLRNAGGAAVTGAVNLRVRLYDHPTLSTNVIFDEEHPGVAVSNGLFGILVGSYTQDGVPDAALNPPGGPAYLGVSVAAGDELLPRMLLASVPHAMQAGRSISAESLVRPGTADAAATVYADGRIGVGTPNPPQAQLDVLGGIRVADDTDDCTPDKAGTIRWNGSFFQGCTGQTWVNFHNPPPELTDIDPDSGSTGGGTAVTLTGQNFVPGASATFDDIPATNVIVTSGTEITADTPAHAAPETVDVRVTNPDGQWSVLSSAFTYVEQIGSSQGTPGNNCKHILDDGSSTGDGVYWIDPNGGSTSDAFEAYCDMTTDGGGWTLILNYLHQAGTAPNPTVRTTNLPLLGSTTLGTNESGTQYWGHAGTTLRNALGFTEFRFYGRTTSHGRIMHFKSSHAGSVNYFKTGLGDCTGLQSNFTPLSGHTASLPASAQYFHGDDGDNALTIFPIYDNVGPFHHWGIIFNRWDMDDFASNEGNIGYSNHYQVYVK